MDVFGDLSAGSIQLRAMLQEIDACNKWTARYGLHLSEEQGADLLARRQSALAENGRVEFGQGILKELAVAFCDCPYVTQDNYLDTLMELQDSFYYFKNESEDQIADDELISQMRRYFDTVCQGSLAYLNGTSLEELCRRTRGNGGEEAEGTGQWDWRDL